MKKFLTLQVPSVFAYNMAQLSSSQPSTYIGYHNPALADPSVTLLDVYVREEPTFIEGLFFDDATNRLLESSGWYAQSRVLWTQIDEPTHSVKVLNSVLNSNIFGEGVCPISDTELMWLTYQTRDVLVLDA